MHMDAANEDVVPATEPETAHEIMMRQPVKPTQAQLEAAFKKVQPKTHWKDRIDALIDPADRDMVHEAVIHFTGTVPTFIEAPNGKLRVRAIGYLMGPCGP
jgi:hypothetical protein